MADKNCASCAGVHTATTGRSPVRRHSLTRRFVHTTANGLRPFGSFRCLAGSSPISLSRAAALSADRSVENSRRAIAAVIPSSNSRWITLSEQVKILQERVEADFGEHPDAEIYLSQPGLGPIARNDRLVGALNGQAFAALTGSPGARAFYDQQRANGHEHNDALRRLANRLVGILHGCPKTRARYDEDTAWAHRRKTTQTTIAA
jgi:hypothetical protein